MQNSEVKFVEIVHLMKQAQFKRKGKSLEIKNKIRIGFLEVSNYCLVLYKEKKNCFKWNKA